MKIKLTRCKITRDDGSVTSINDIVDVPADRGASLVSRGLAILVDIKDDVKPEVHEEPVQPEITEVPEVPETPAQPEVFAEDELQEDEVQMEEPQTEIQIPDSEPEAKPEELVKEKPAAHASHSSHTNKNK